jgi:hypothetical protein
VEPTETLAAVVVNVATRAVRSVRVSDKLSTIVFAESFIVPVTEGLLNEKSVIVFSLLRAVGFDLHETPIITANKT